MRARTRGVFLAHLRNTLFALLAFAAAGVAHAEWVQIGRSDDFRVYIEPRSIQPAGENGYARLWQLADFAVAQWADAQTAVGSIKSLIEYDCRQGRSRMLAAEAYSEQMAVGRLVASERPAAPKWENIEPGSAAETILKHVCGEKR